MTTPRDELEREIAAVIFQNAHQDNDEIDYYPAAAVVIDLVRRATLEEAARVCEDWAKFAAERLPTSQSSYRIACLNCRDDIRTLATQTLPPGLED